MPFIRRYKAIDLSKSERKHAFTMPLLASQLIDSTPFIRRYKAIIVSKFRSIML